jgi:hypothetical protein
VFAPLALKFVQSRPSKKIFFSFLTNETSRRAPVLTINANGDLTRRRPSGRKRDIGAIVGGIICGVAAIFAVIGVVIFLQRRRRWDRPKSVLSSPTDSREAGPLALVTPSDLNLNSPGLPRDAGVPPEQQPLVDDNPDTGMVTPHRRSSSSFSHRLSSSSPTILPLPQPVEPVPVGLSDKEIARLRAQTLGPGFQQPQTRSNVSQPETTSSANAAIEYGEASSSYETRRLQSEVESLRREMDRLREIERLRAEVVTEAPPSYTEGDR